MRFTYEAFLGDAFFFFLGKQENLTLFGFVVYDTNKLLRNTILSTS